ncbi:alpha/beta hydrolase [Mycobacterium sp. URHB0044]|uniref:alpha/beta hydrolase n=1 Tax=Mycobacterium sp. URHB0044 TaxID=1380386 RepID=UPI00048E0807|nr:alpha/beta hydrolase [Mycobacterium sp. URHB0044]
MQLSEIESWSVGALLSIAFELGDELKTIDGVADELELISQLPGWDSPAADAARGRIRSTTSKVLDDAAVIRAVHQLAEEMAAAVAKLQAGIEAVRADVAAQGGLLQLSDFGDVTISAPSDMRDELRAFADDIEARAKALIHQADDVDADCAEVFGHLEHGDVTSGGGTDGGLSAPYPPEGDAKDVNAWWDTLSDGEQRKVIAEHPEWIGNRDGVPAWARSAANIPALDRELAAAQRDVDGLGSRDDFIRSHPEMDPAQAAAVYTQVGADRHTRLDNAKAMREALSVNNDPSKGYDPDRYLMLLEFPGGRDPRAAIAVGNPDTAEHVAVTTPGMNTHPTSLPAMVLEASALRSETESQLALSGRLDQQVATIAWLGYDPPDTDDISILQAGYEGRANDAAPDLADFYRGINAANEHGSDVHLSALGHSYGSLTTAQALNELGQTGVVDDAAFYGSPGLGSTDRTVGWGPLERAVPIGDEADLSLADHHAYVMSTPNDPVSGNPTLLGLPLPALGDLGQLGPNPTTLPLEQLSTGATTTHDGVARDGASGHSEYPRFGGNGYLRTTGYNLAIITGGLAGVPGLLVRP